MVVSSQLWFGTITAAHSQWTAVTAGLQVWTMWCHAGTQRFTVTSLTMKQPIRNQAGEGRSWPDMSPLTCGVY